ncbi:MAG: TolC family protein [Verrucomicrobiota bacterium]
MQQKQPEFDSIRAWDRLSSALDVRQSCVLVALGLVVLSSCTPTQYQEWADREAYTILFSKSELVENVDYDSVSLGTGEPAETEKIEIRGAYGAYLAETIVTGSDSRILSLDDALSTSVRRGRSYLNEKERVFLSALDLTLARHRLAPIFSIDGDVLRAGDSRQAQALTNLVSTNTFSRTRSAGFDMLYRTGARISADFTQDFLRFITGTRSINESDLAVSLVQPLLQGAGTTVTLEALTQQERVVLYDLRDFADFRRAFIVDVVSDYYGVLQARDRIENARLAYQGFLASVEQAEAFAEEGKITKAQLGQLQQAALQAESRLINTTRVFETQLDQFKLFIGLPVADSLTLDQSELGQLVIEPVEISREEAVRIALVSRPDLATANDVVEDAERGIKVARNGLLPGLDVSVDYNARSDPGDTTPAINFERRRWATSLDFDLPLDRKAERNDYRASRIFLDRARRSRDLNFDQARISIYDAWRAIEQAEQNFEIAEKGVELASDRLEEQQLLAELGRGNARDLIDAQNDLLDAKNQRTSTLVDHALARLRLWRDMGILYIKSDGSWAKRLARESD